jgi:hypothetical protein
MSTMDYLDLSNLLRFDLMSKDDRIQILLIKIFVLSFLVAILSRWPYSTGFFTFLCLFQIHVLGFVPEEHDYWIGLTIQTVGSWIVSMLLGYLSETFVSFCRRYARNACNYIAKFLGSFAICVAVLGSTGCLWYFKQCYRCVTRPLKRFSAALSRARVAFYGGIDTNIPDNGNGHNTPGDFHENSVHGFDDVESKDEANKENRDASTTPSTLTAGTVAMTLSDFDKRSSCIRIMSQLSHVRRLQDSSEGSDAHEDSSEESDAHGHSE